MTDRKHTPGDWLILGAGCTGLLALASLPFVLMWWLLGPGLTWTTEAAVSFGFAVGSLAGSSPLAAFGVLVLMGLAWLGLASLAPYGGSGLSRLEVALGRFYVPRTPKEKP